MSDCVLKKQANEERLSTIKISPWKGCCHWCNRGSSVAGEIGDVGLCELCGRNGRLATW